MRKIFLLATFSLFTLATFAQDAGVKDMHNQATRSGKADEKKSNKNWKTGGTFSVNFGQGGSRNWAAGAEKYSFSLAAYASFYANRHVGKWNWNNTLDLGYAFVNTASQGVRKNDDKIDLFSKAGRDINPKLSIGLVGNFRSQFTNGYTYNYLGKYQRRISGLFAPAYATIAPGLDWHPNTNFSIFLSPISARTVIVTQQTKSYYFPGGVIPAADGGGFELPVAALYGVDPARQVRMELGSFASLNFNKEIMKNVTYKSRLDLYANYLPSYRFAAVGPDQLAITEVKPKPQNVDVFWTNTINMKVNKWLQVTYNFDLIYDDDVRQFGANKTSAAAQLRSLLGVGLAAKF